MCHVLIRLCAIPKPFAVILLVIEIVTVPASWNIVVVMMRNVIRMLDLESHVTIQEIFVVSLAMTVIGTKCVRTQTMEVDLLVVGIGTIVVMILIAMLIALVMEMTAVYVRLAFVMMEMIARCGRDVSMIDVLVRRCFVKIMAPFPTTALECIGIQSPTRI